MSAQPIEQEILELSKFPLIWLSRQLWVSNIVDFALNCTPFLLSSKFFEVQHLKYLPRGNRAVAVTVFSCYAST